MSSSDRKDPADLSDTNGPSSQQASARTDELIGRCIVGKFVIRELIGEEPAARVYRADQVALNRSVAVKVLRPALSKDIELAQRFHDEAFAVSRLFHPNVVSIYDYGRTRDGLLYIAMEYLQGRTLGSVIHDRMPLPIARVVDLFSQILKALEEAHATGVVHADLKSDNVIVEDLRDGRPLAKVLDFGIAHLLQSNAAAAVAVSSPTLPRVTAGSPEYMAPEVIAGQPPNAASDIYSAGVVLHEIVTGRLPLDGADSSPDNDASGDDEEREIRAKLEKIAARALSRDPKARYTDVASFRGEVQATLDDFAKSIVCAECGSENETQFRFCAECGARLMPVREARRGDRQIELAKSEAKAAFASGKTDKAIEIMHQAIGRAIRLGDRNLIIECYQTLGLLQAETGATKSAIAELEEALDLVTAGGATETTTEVPPSLWQVQLQLAKLYHAVGRQRDALSMGSRALVSARQISSINGRKSVQTFMTKLYGQVREKTAGPVEILSTPELASSGSELFASERSLQQFLDERETSPWLLLDPSNLSDDIDPGTIDDE